MAPSHGDISREQTVKRLIKLPSLSGSEVETAANTSAVNTDATTAGRPAISKTKISKSSCTTSSTKTPPGGDERKWDNSCGPPCPSLVQRKTPLRRRSGNFSLPVCYKYVVVPGNNSRAVLAAFRGRPWWGPARRNEYENKANNGGGRRRSQSSRGDRRASALKGGPEGYGKGFNLWWEMYVSRPVIENTNLDVNLRQAVNHFEFNHTLVSKKGLYRSLRQYCDSGVDAGDISIEDIVPRTFYLAGGAAQDKNTDRQRSAGLECDDDRAEFLSYHHATDGSALQVLPTPTKTKRSGGNTPADEQYVDLGQQNATQHENNLAQAVTSPPVPPRRNRKAPPADDRTRLRMSITAEGNPLTSTSPNIDHRGDGRSTGDTPYEDNGQNSNSDTSDGARAPSVKLPANHILVAENCGRCEEGIMRQDGVGSKAEVLDSSVRTDHCALMPTWVVKPAANSNCGFGIHVCCSAKEVLDVVDERGRKVGRSGWIVQRYIERPLLIRGRKFDIRMFVLLVADPSTRSWRRRRSASTSAASTVLRTTITPGPVLMQREQGSVLNEYGDGSGGAVDLGEIGSGLTANGNSAGLASNGGGSALCSNLGSCRAWAEHGNVGTPEIEKTSNVARAYKERTFDRRKSNPAGSEPSPLTAWCHRNAYVRMSSVKYSNDPEKVKDRYVHLTNDAVQRRSSTYGQGEPGNKLTLEDLQSWLDGDESNHQGRAVGWVEDTLRPRMHKLVSTSVAAAAAAGINRQGRPHAFELLGYDFMVDDDLRVWLIEVNSNPCLEFACPILESMIVTVIDDTLSLALDPVFRPPAKHRKKTTEAAASAGDGGEKASGMERSHWGYAKVYPEMEDHLR